MSAIDNLTDIKLTKLLRMVRELTDEEFEQVIECLSSMEEVLENKHIDKDQMQLNLNN
jgi:hypothetical protein